MRAEQQCNAPRIPVIDPKGGALSTHKVKYFVTSPKFVNINGVPYLEAAATESLIS